MAYLEAPCGRSSLMTLLIIFCERLVLIFCNHWPQEKDDLLSRFVKMSKQGDNRFGDRALRDIMVNYILAGRDSTSAVICWTMYMLVLNPEALSKVRQELAELMQKQSPPSGYRNSSLYLLIGQGQHDTASQQQLWRILLFLVTRINCLNLQTLLYTCGVWVTSFIRF